MGKFIFILICIALCGAIALEFSSKYCAREGARQEAQITTKAKAFSAELVDEAKQQAQKLYELRDKFSSTGLLVALVGVGLFILTIKLLKKLFIAMIIILAIIYAASFFM